MLDGKRGADIENRHGDPVGRGGWSELGGSH